MSTNALIVSLAVLAIAGCDSPRVTAPAPPDLTVSDPGSPVGPVMVVAHPDGFEPSDDEAQRHRDLQARAAFRRAVRDAVAGAATWVEADGAVRQMLREHPGVPPHEKEQLAAILMLQQHLLPGESEPTAERLAAVAHHTEGLVRHRNPNPLLIDEALSVLDGYWSPAAIRRAAASAYSAAERYVAARTDCDGCSIDAARQRTGGAGDHAAVSASLDGAMEQALLGAERLSDRF